MKKIVTKIPMYDDPKRQSMAMKTATRITGIVSVSLEGNHKDQLAVVGEGVDAIELITLLRKKFGFAEIINVEGLHKNIEKKDEEGGGEKKDMGGGGKGVGGSEKKDKPDDSDKKDKEGGGRGGGKNDKANGELRKMGANKVYCGMFTYGPGTCTEAVLREQKQEELAVDCSPFNEGWLLTVAH